MFSKHHLQVDLSTLLAAPLLFAPSFLGFSVGTEQARGVDLRTIWLHLLVVAVVYMVAFCWLVTRHFDRRSDFRKFPFRGSMLIGAVLGPCFTIQFAVGAFSASLYHDAALVLNLATLISITSQGIVLVFEATAIGIFFGGWLGVFAGSGYCIARHLREALTGKSTIRPGQAKRRIGVE